MFLIFHALFADQPLKFCPFPNQTGKRVASRNDQTTEGRGGGDPQMILQMKPALPLIL